MCVCVFIAPKLLSDATRYLSCRTSHRPHGSWAFPFRGYFYAPVFGILGCLCCVSIYAEFSMQHFHTLALINPHPAALVNMHDVPPSTAHRPPVPQPPWSCSCHTVGTYKPMQTHTRMQAARSAIENHCALVNDTFVDQRIRENEPHPLDPAIESLLHLATKSGAPAAAGAASRIRICMCHKPGGTMHTGL